MLNFAWFCISPVAVISWKHPIWRVNQPWGLSAPRHPLDFEMCHPVSVSCSLCFDHSSMKQREARISFLPVLLDSAHWTSAVAIFAGVKATSVSPKDKRKSKLSASFPLAAKSAEEAVIPAIPSSPRRWWQPITVDNPVLFSSLLYTFLRGSSTLVGVGNLHLTRIILEY